MSEMQKPLLGQAAPETEEIERFLDRIYFDRNTGCWLWLGKCNSEGYGHFRGNKVHRYSYETFHGPIPEGIEPDHTCHNNSDCEGGKSCAHRRCANPDHIEPITHGENVRRGRGLAAQNARRTHCERGHPFDRVRPMAVGVVHEEKDTKKTILSIAKRNVTGKTRSIEPMKNFAKKRWLELNFKSVLFIILLIHSGGVLAYRWNQPSSVNTGSASANPRSPFSGSCGEDHGLITKLLCSVLHGRFRSNSPSSSGSLPCSHEWVLDSTRPDVASLGLLAFWHCSLCPESRRTSTLIRGSLDASILPRLYISSGGRRS